MELPARPGRRKIEMRKQAFGMLAMLSLLLMLAAASVHAQTNRSTINIPFSFTVGHKTLPAGEYTIEPARRESDNVWQIQTKDGHSNVFFTTTSVWSKKTQEDTRLVFNNYDGQYFLSQIWSNGSNSGREVHVSRPESTLAKNGATRARVVLAASR